MMNISEFLDMRGHEKKTSGKKILIADNVKNANRLVRKSGRILFNVEIKTLYDIISEAITAEFAREGRIRKPNILGDKACTYILYDILKENRPEFLPEESLGINTAAGFLNIINKIRTGIPTEEYENDDSDKITQIKGIIAEYEKCLKDRELYDHARLLNTDRKYFEHENVSYYALESKNRTKKETEFIRFLTKGREYISYLADLPDNYNYRLSYGIENEVMSIADNIAGQKSEKLGNYAIYYTGEEYDNVIMGVFESRGIPCALTSGVCASQTNLVSFMLSVLNWAKDKYLYKSLTSVMINPIICLDKNNNSSVYRQYVSFLDSSLVYGIENYGKWLDKKEKEAKEYISDKKTEQEIEKERENKLAFISLLRELVSVFSEDHTLSELFKKLLEFTKKYSNNRYYEEKKMLYKRLGLAENELKFYSGGSIDESIDTLIDFLQDMKMNYCERSDAVLAVRLSAVEVMERKHNFFIGLSAMQFNSNIAESPILSDEEIKKYLDDEDLISSSVNDIKRRNLEDTLKTAPVDADITLSSIAFDTVDLKPATPAPVYMELLGDNELPDKIYGYNDVPNKNVRFIRSEKRAEKPRKLDRKFENVRDISPSGFQVLLECPQHFFFNKIIGIYETEFKERDAGKWLESNETGTYCHSVLEKYVNEVIIKGKKDSFDEEMFSRIFNEVFAQAEEEVFCDNVNLKESKKRYESKRLKKCIKNMHAEFNESGFMPIACEAKFEKAEKALSKDDWSDKINFHGTIDRIDKNDKGEYRVIDYKTGGYKSDKEDTYKQHIAYPLASDIESVDLGNNVKFIYEYIFSKKNDEMCKVKQGEECELTDEELELMKSVLDNKDYSVSYEKIAENNKTCKYCKFVDICNMKMGGDQYGDQ